MSKWPDQRDRSSNLLLSCLSAAQAIIAAHMGACVSFRLSIVQRCLFHDHKENGGYSTQLQDTHFAFSQVIAVAQQRILIMVLGSTVILEKTSELRLEVELSCFCRPLFREAAACCVDPALLRLISKFPVRS